MTPNDDDDAALRARMEALRNEIRAKTPAPPASAPTNPAANDSGSQMSMAMRAGSEFVAAVLVGAAIGWGLDGLFHSKPLFIILFFLLGVVAGVMNVIRATSPKAKNFVRDSRLSEKSAEDKDVPRGSPRGGDDNGG